MVTSGIDLVSTTPTSKPVSMRQQRQLATCVTFSDRRWLLVACCIVYILKKTPKIESEGTMRPRLPFGNSNKNASSDSLLNPNDPTEWLINSGLAEFLLLHTLPIKYMIMFGYTYLNGTVCHDTIVHRIVASLTVSGNTRYFDGVLSHTFCPSFHPQVVSYLPMPLHRVQLV